MQQFHRRQENLCRHLETVCEHFHDIFDKSERGNPYILSWQCHSEPIQTSTDAGRAQKERENVCTLFCRHTPSAKVIFKCLYSQNPKIELTGHEARALKYLYAFIRERLMVGKFRHVIGAVCVHLIHESKDKKICRVSRSENARWLLFRNNQISNRELKASDWHIVQFELRPFDVK